MTPFLQQTARHFYELTGGSGDFCYIFPNRRSMLFFKKYYAEPVKESCKSMIAPAMLTINDFFYKLCDKTPTDRIDLLLSLYKCYCECYCSIGTPETLDEFIFWGEIILADFNDVDKYCVDARKIFTNVAEFKGMQDHSYLTDKQKEALEAFMGHFSPNNDDKEVKRRFRNTWDILYPLYQKFNKLLENTGKAYEGMVYRALAQRFENESAVDILAENFPEVKQFVFIGLNAPSKSEKEVLRKLKKAGIAQFCWDYSSEWIKDRNNRSSFFMEENVSDFGQAFKLDPDGLKPPKINVLSVPSRVGQCKQTEAVFGKFEEPVGIETAIVLPDETLLLPMLNSIPEDVRKVNVTMGYPMSGSLIHSLMQEIISLQMHLRYDKDGEVLYYHKEFGNIAANSLFVSVLNDDEKVALDKVLQEKRHYVKGQDIHVGEDSMIDIVFHPVVKDIAAADSGQITELCDYMQSVVTSLAKRLLAKGEKSIELDFAQQYYLAVDRLKKYAPAILPATFSRLLNNLIGKGSVPFKGEPLEGLQIMGPLETRCLDFKNVVILSCNEGTFPKHNVGDSFIPSELRKGFDLPTYEYQDSLWAYYFYRLIQRAENVWMLLNTSHSSSLKSAEESRYIKQLEMHFGAEITRYIAKSDIKTISADYQFDKTEDQIDRLKKDHLSASAIKDYLQCPRKFYFARIEKLKKPDEVEESMDNAEFGNVYHRAMQLLYSKFDPSKDPLTQDGKDCKYQPRDYITVKDIDDILKRDVIGSLVEKLIMNEIKGIEISGRNLISKHIVSESVKRTLEYDRKKMLVLGVDGFRILGLEKYYEMTTEGFTIVGIVDRMDSFEDGVLRIVDYKTGKVSDKDVNLNKDAVGNLFAGDKTKYSEKPTIALQLYLYNELVNNNIDSNIKDFCSRQSVIYQTARIFSEGEYVAEGLDDNAKGLEEGLKYTLLDIANTSKGWDMTKNNDNCKYCDFKSICGK